MTIRSALISCAVALTAFAGPAAWAAAPSGSSSPGLPDPFAKKVTGSPNYVSMFGIRASVADGFSVAAFLSVDAGLDVPDAKVRKKVVAIRPRIMDALRRAVASYANLGYELGYPPNLEMMRARMQKAVDAQIGPGEAQVVLASVIVFDSQ